MQGLSNGTIKCLSMYRRTDIQQFHHDIHDTSQYNGNKQFPNGTSLGPFHIRNQF